MEPAPAENTFTEDVNSRYPYQHPNEPAVHRVRESHADSSGTYDVQPADFLTPTLDLSRQDSSSPPLVVRLGARQELRETLRRPAMPVITEAEFEEPKSAVPWWVWGLVCVIVAVGFIVLLGEAR